MTNEKQQPKLTKTLEQSVFEQQQLIQVYYSKALIAFKEANKPNLSKINEFSMFLELAKYHQKNTELLLLASIDDKLGELLELVED